MPIFNECLVDSRTNALLVDPVILRSDGTLGEEGRTVSRPHTDSDQPYYQNIAIKVIIDDLVEHYGSDIANIRAQFAHQAQVAGDDDPNLLLISCPISQEILRDPVVASDGFTYERVWIEAAYRRSNLSPLTRDLLQADNDTVRLIPNNMLRALINSYVGADIQNQEQPVLPPTLVNEDQVLLAFQNRLLSGLVVGAGIASLAVSSSAAGSAGAYSAGADSSNAISIGLRVGGLFAASASALASNSDYQPRR